jgi:hypothetical protein
MSWVECPKCGVLYRGEHNCPKEVATASGLSAMRVEITPGVLDHFAAFEIDVDMDEWISLYLHASKSLGKVLGEPTATHLWAKFRDTGLLRTWALLDKDNRDIIVAMLKIWKGATSSVSSHSPKKWERLSFIESEAIIRKEEIPMFTPAFLSDVKEAWTTKKVQSFWEWIMEPKPEGVAVRLRGVEKPHEFFPAEIIEKMVYDETRKVYVVS